jgi:hypothetical protein
VFDTVAGAPKEKDRGGFVEFTRRYDATFQDSGGNGWLKGICQWDILSSTIINLIYTTCK